jgi:hypothetical protein
MGGRRPECAEQEGAHMDNSQALSQRRTPGPGPTATNHAITRKLYEVCITRGYVDSRDWQELAAQLRAEKALVRQAPGPT